MGGQDRTCSTEGIFFLPHIRRYFYFSIAFNFPEGLHGVVGVSRFLHFTKKAVFLIGLMGSFSCFHIITTLLLFEFFFFFFFGKLLFATLNFDYQPHILLKLAFLIIEAPLKVHFRLALVSCNSTRYGLVTQRVINGEEGSS